MVENKIGGSRIPKTSIFIRTWGCTLNQSDSDIMAALLEEAGFELVENIQDAEVVLFNTCTVKGGTENKILTELNRIVHIGKKVVVAGCLSVNSSKIRSIAPKAPIVGTGAVENIVSAVKDALNGRNTEYSNITNKSSLPRRLGKPIVRIPIQEGCVGNCAFCQTKIARPIMMSYSEKDLVCMVKEAVFRGAVEIQLTGMDTGAYGMDIKSGLVGLLERLCSIEGDFRIRLGMINPNHFKRMINGLLKVYRNEKMYKFAHMPVQTGSEKVCNDMGRAHSVHDFEYCVKKLRENIPEVTIATDIIVGYPSEEDNDFKETIDMLERVRPDVVNISKFTPRPGTRAKKLKQLPSEVVKKRTVQTHEIVKRIWSENAQGFLGKEIEVWILEKGKKGQMKARAGSYRQIVVNGSSKLLGEKVRVNVKRKTENSLLGKIVI
ncbi:tRNA (N(6)-L-threonylcarbamoyladenosine(37)-C(2))-methylthiotransferase [Candidatus Micrarchaeota archaeon]|nr:tRNA (N(6)-L-threonylcarbamoyladenosine(37)-C(2))-methylthiotransferase [Candidatus Micrarchaeota archaeon]